jgi:hypothetical protein
MSGDVILRSANCTRFVAHLPLIAKMIAHLIEGPALIVVRIGKGLLARTEGFVSFFTLHGRCRLRLTAISKVSLTQN